MADLELTASEAIIAVRQLEGRIADANGRLNQLREGPLDAIEEQCESGWARLEEQVKTFLQQIDQKQGMLHELGRDAGGSLGGTREALNKAYTVAESHLQEAASMIGALRQEVAAVEPEVATLLEGLQANAQTLEQQLTTVETELEQATQEARTFIGVEVVQALHAMQEQIRQRAAAVRQVVAEECQAPVEAAEIDWATKLAEVMGTVEEAFTGTAEHAQKVAAYSIWKCEEAFTETLGEVKNAADTLERALESFREEAEQAKMEGTEATGALDGAVLDTIDALGSASTTVTGVLTELAKFTWGSL